MKAKPEKSNIKRIGKSYLSYLKARAITTGLFIIFLLGGILLSNIFGGFIGFSLLFFMPSTGLITALAIYSYQKRRQTKQWDFNKNKE